MSRKQRVSSVTNPVTLKMPEVVWPVSVTFLPVDGPQWFLVDARGTLIRNGKGLVRFKTRPQAEKAAQEKTGKQNP